MSLDLFTGALPKASGGRKPREADQELYQAILDVLKAHPTVQENGETRPQVVGDPKRLHDSAGKAASDGRIYARPMADALKRTVRVRVVETKPGSGKWGWVLYIPMTEAKPKNSK